MFDEILAVALAAVCLAAVLVYGIGSRWTGSRMGVSLFTTLTALAAITVLNALARFGIYDRTVARVAFIFLIAAVTILTANFVTETKAGRARVAARAAKLERNRNGKSTRNPTSGAARRNRTRRRGALPAGRGVGERSEGGPEDPGRE